MLCAVRLVDLARRPRDSATVISGSAVTSSRLLRRRLSSGRAGMPGGHDERRRRRARPRARRPRRPGTSRAPARASWQPRRADELDRASRRRTRRRARRGSPPSCRTRSSAARSAPSRAGRPRPRRRDVRPRSSGIVLGSVIMKKRKTRISGEETSSHQNSAPSIGPTCQAAVIVCPLAASTPIPAANASQKPTRDPDEVQSPEDQEASCRRSAPARTRARATAAPTTARVGPRARRRAAGSTSTRPKLDGLKM